MLIDNKKNNKLDDVLKSHIKMSADLSIVTRYFKSIKKTLKSNL